MNKDHAWRPGRLPIGDLRQRADLQLRVQGVDAAHVRRLRRTLSAGEDLEPIKAAKVGKVHYVADGFHRLAAYTDEGRLDIPVLWAAMSLDEARDVALAANVTHGKALTQADKAKRLAVYVERGKHLGADGRVKASRVISAELGGTYSHTTVRTKLRAMNIEVEEAVEFPGGYKAWGSASADEVDVDLIDETWEQLERFGQLFGSMPDEHQAHILQAARELVATLERGERPPANLRLDV